MKFLRRNFKLQRGLFLTALGAFVYLGFSLAKSEDASSELEKRESVRLISEGQTFVTSDVPNDEFVGKVISVADGDTITVMDNRYEPHKVRLVAIDAPEGMQEFGNQSKRALMHMIAGKTVQIRMTGKDRYGRILGWVICEGIDVNRQMVADGWAWHFTRYNQDADIAKLQEQAQAQRKGLWRSPNPPMAPWDYRDLKRNSGEEASNRVAQPSSLGANSLSGPTSSESSHAPYWINANGGVRHNRSCRWFGNTKRGHFSTQPVGKPCSIGKG